MRIEKQTLTTWELNYTTDGKLETVTKTFTPTEFAAIKRTKKYKKTLLNKRKLVEISIITKTL